MYAISNANRIYTLIFLCLCAAFLLAPSLAVANDGYWSTAERRFISQNEVNLRLERIANSSIAKPSGSTLSTVPSAPTITKNATGGLSATTNNILKTLEQPSTFNSTSNYSSTSAKTALKSCVRSPACAGRALGAGAVIYEGITAWKDVYDILADNSGNPVQAVPKPVPPTDPSGVTCVSQSGLEFSTCSDGLSYANSVYCGGSASYCPLTLVPSSGGRYTATGSNGTPFMVFYALDVCPSGSSVSVDGCVSDTEYENKPVSYAELDQMIDDAYDPVVSDAPIVLLSGDPETISLTTPAPAELPATTTTNTDSQGKTTTTVKNAVITYNILNNNSSNPSIESTITETSNTYDDTANLVGSMTSTTTNNAVAPDPLPPSSGASADIELPPFCTYASIVCDWIGWTKEGIEGEQPDLINLISEFEPDEQQYNSGIGSGSCPAPMSLNLGIINRTVEVSYQPFCDFLDMIRPLVIAGAWLLSAFMYVGVLRRG